MRILTGVLVMSFLLCSKAINAKADPYLYLQKKFGIEKGTISKITFHTKQAVAKEFSNIASNENDLKEIMRKQWASAADSSIDSVYSVDGNNKLNGVFVDFMGDSTSGYTFGYYLHGEKDSVWITFVSNEYKKVEHYKSGKPHGIYESIYSDGRKGFQKKYKNGALVDTSVEWWPNGKLMEMEVFDKGNSVVRRCYEEDGKTETECE